jgi:trehalose-6-phosphate synthase
MPSGGGIISILLGTKRYARQMTCIGLSGLANVPSNEAECNRISKLYATHNCVPLFVDKKEETNYFMYCNRVLWPVMHNFVERCIYRESYWLAYERVCKRFAEECAQRAEDGDLIWIHGINLMMVGWFLKDLIQVIIHVLIKDSFDGRVLIIFFFNFKSQRTVTLRQSISVTLTCHP